MEIASVTLADADGLPAVRVLAGGGYLDRGEIQGEIVAPVGTVTLGQAWCDSMTLAHMKATRMLNARPDRVGLPGPVLRSREDRTRVSVLRNLGSVRPGGVGGLKPPTEQGS